jgi:hypothetical protein
MNGDYQSFRGRLLAGACWIQAVAAVIAAVAVFVDVESILVSCPALALMGYVLALAAIQQVSISLLLFGLSCPIITSAIALLIASFDWGPREAVLPVRVLLTLNAATTLAWGTRVGRKILRCRSLVTAADAPPFRFSLMSLLALVTFTCLLFAAVRRLAPDGEMVYFAAYGVTVLVLSLVVALRYFYCVRSIARASKDESHSSPPTAMPNAP